MRRLDLRKVQGARSSRIRYINRQIVLNYVREREPISRAEIARETALQRSTVSTIVEELKADGLVEEIGAGKSTGGRRPTLLRLHAAGPIAIGVDVTPSYITVATSDLLSRHRNLKLDCRFEPRGGRRRRYYYTRLAADCRRA